MSEPNASKLFDFEFEKNDHQMSDAEVRHHMYQEVCLYRPGGADTKHGGHGGYGGHAADHKGSSHDGSKMDVGKWHTAASKV